MALLKPPHLAPGDTIGIVSPSWGGAGAFPHRAEQGARQLRALGFNVKFAPHAFGRRGHVSDTPANRAADLHELFGDPQVSAVLAAIGGDHSCQLLPLLDFELLRANPKVFMGYSDISVLNLAIHQRTGLVTFNGPALLTDFGEHPAMLDYTRAHFLAAVGAACPPGPQAPAAEWTEELLSWAEKKDLTRPRALQPSPGWTWLKPGAQPAQGPLLGGCIESLQHLRGTPYWPDWTGAIFFWETSEDKPSPETIDGILMDYENMGVLDQIAGMLVGRPMGYTAKEKERLNLYLLERTSAYHFPIVTGMDFGHTAPQLTLPLGCAARIDTQRQEFAILEAAVS